ncbi:MAG TPA: Flp pilus assembly protein CpaB [Allosphingosinicella sp.]|uniref:Flp pilus assembly protein CpaB n=1 Tax=Allosphingosinicella sp. TaxID=2823234 RepID=UPI002EDABBE1
MRRQSLVILGVAVLLGLIAVYLTNVYLTGAENQQKAREVPTAQVAVARVPLEFGMPVTADKIRFVDWPRSSMPPGTFSSLRQIVPAGKVHTALRPIEVGEPILRTKLSGEGGRATLSALLPPEMRAAAIRITDVAGVAGFVLPGDRVDVLVTRTAGGDNGRQVTDILLQDVRVIAIDQSANDSAQKPMLAKTATLEVTQVDAQKLALAQTVGQLSLALRSAMMEPGGGLVQTVDSGDLRHGAYAGAYRRASGYVPQYNRPIIRRQAAPQPMAPPRPVTSNVEVIRGTAGSNYEVGRYGGN